MSDSEIFLNKRELAAYFRKSAQPWRTFYRTFLE
jgi:hypothetical protein